MEDVCGADGAEGGGAARTGVGATMGVGEGELEEEEETEWDDLDGPFSAETSSLCISTSSL